ncbi:MAG: PQQ-like beta-propeller repeat protein [Pirellulales bacterium]|nr:PQQ-like beta-propeller repeat protein [Pirellulales bacterium]
MNTTPKNRLLTVCLFGTLALGWAPLATSNDADWPQWRGPHRDGHAAAQSLLTRWPEGGPDLKWTFTNAGRGYSSVAIVGNQVYTMGARKNQCFVICLDLATGKPLWERPISRAGTGDDYLDGWGAGPRSTPTVDGDQVFALSDVGVLACLSKQGEIQWSVDLVQDHGGGIPKWGYSESALVDGDRVVVTPGGDNFMIALNRHTGEKIWNSQDTSEPAEYVSVMRGSVGSTDFYVTASTPGLLAFDTQSGKPLFSDTATGNRTAVIPTPILVQDKLYHTSDYGAGNTLLQLSDDEGEIQVESLYHLSDKTMRNHHGGVVLFEGVIYGFSKANGGVWMAQDLASGETLWEEKIRGNRSGSLCFADGHLYCYNDKDASLFLVQPDRSGWSVKGKLTLPKQTELPRDRGAIWSHPVVAQQTLFVRDQDLIYAYDIAR